MSPTIVKSRIADAAVPESYRVSRRSALRHFLLVGSAAVLVGTRASADTAKPQSDAVFIRS